MKITHGLLIALVAQVGLAEAAQADPVAYRDTRRAISSERAIDTSGLPADCRQFLQVPADAVGDWLAWSQRLSLAACEESHSATPVVTSVAQLQSAVADLDRSVQPSVALYRDALAHGPAQIQMLAADGLGMAYVDVMVRARNSVHAPADLMSNMNAADTYLALHQAVEPLLDTYARNADAAFAEADRLAAQDPARAAANKVMRDAMISAHARRVDLAGR